jgi:hypothetical protein
MNKNTLLFLFSLFNLTCIAQSKKEKIELLQQRFDSLQVAHHQLIVTSVKTEIDFSLSKELAEKRMDSLNTLRLNELKRSQTISAQLNEANARNQKNDQEILELKVSLQQSESALITLTHRVDLLLDSVTMYKKAFEKTVTVRDLSDRKFSQNELDFIIEEFKKEVLNYTEEDLGAVVQYDNDNITIHVDGELGYVPAFELKKKILTWVAGDLDHDGTNEIIFDVVFTAGGTAAWFELYCLKLSENGAYSLIHLDAPCPCKNKLDCREPTANILGFSNNVITINSECFGSNDAMCCPSSELKAKYTFSHDKLILMN